MRYCCGDQLTAVVAQLSIALSQAEGSTKPGFARMLPRVSGLEDRHSHCRSLPAVIQVESNASYSQDISRSFACIGSAAEVSISLFASLDCSTSCSRKYCTISHSAVRIA